MKADLSWIDRLGEEVSVILKDKRLYTGALVCVDEYGIKLQLDITTSDPDQPSIRDVCIPFEAMSWIKYPADD